MKWTLIMFGKVSEMCQNFRKRKPLELQGKQNKTLVWRRVLKLVVSVSFTIGPNPHEWR
jgi:hypothetical protein